ncbi:MAG: response regulator [bacterium]|jgi:DNA-binding NarL/FixJ family response regulator
MVSFETKTSRILVVDDHPIVRHGLSEIINEEENLEVVGEAESAQQALQDMERLQPDLVIVDISLKDSNGLDLIERIKTLHPGVKILVSSIYEESVYAERALRSGALGYVNKQASPTSLISAIHCVLNGKVYLSENQKNVMFQSFINHNSDNAYSIQHLSNREIEIFEFIGRGKSTREIADLLNVSVKTIETHRENIKRKLNIDNTNELIYRAVHWLAQQA